MIKFYTVPQYGIRLPFLLVQINDESLFNVVLTTRKYVRDIIIDVGILLFQDKNVKDYPHGFLYHVKKMMRLRNRFKSVGIKNIHIVIPDYPDHFHPKNLWISRRITNIERTTYNIVKTIETFPDEKDWIIPIQTHFNKPHTVLRAIDLLEKWNILPHFDRYAVSLSMRPTYDTQLIKIASRHLSNKRIHAFGATLETIGKCWKLIDSFDKSIGFGKNLLFRDLLRKLLKYLHEDELPCSKKELSAILRLEDKTAVRDGLENAFSIYAWFLYMIRKYNIEFEAINHKNVEDGFFFLLDKVVENRKKKKKLYNYNKITSLANMYPLTN